jgi:PhzF family phenazine biosynthesis protein
MATPIPRKRRMSVAEIKVYTENAFCKNGEGGNPAGVVLFESALSDARKKEIAAKLGYSETAFVTRGDRADFKFEYFTPTEEVPLCGHATIAAFALMLELGMLDRDSYSFEAKAGLLSVRIDDGSVFMEQNKAQYFEILEKSALEDCFDTDCVSEKYPSQIVSTGLRDIMLPIRDEAALNAAKPNLDAISEISRSRDVVGIHAFALCDAGILCRNFAPLYGIPEESATGTANCALASYLHKHGIMRRNEYRIEQGRSMNMPSEITVRITETGEEISKIFVGGKGRFIGVASYA